MGGRGQYSWVDCWVEPHPLLLAGMASAVAAVPALGTPPLPSASARGRGTSATSLV